MRIAAPKSFLWNDFDRASGNSSLNSRNFTTAAVKWKTQQTYEATKRPFSHAQFFIPVKRDGVHMIPFNRDPDRPDRDLGWPGWPGVSYEHIGFFYKENSGRARSRSTRLMNRPLDLNVTGIGYLLQDTIAVSVRPIWNKKLTGVRSLAVDILNLFASEAPPQTSSSDEWQPVPLRGGVHVDKLR